MKTIDEITSKDFWAHNLTLKLAIIGVMILLLLIPLNMVEDIIIEREESNAQVDKEMLESWGNQQNISGPILQIPVKYTYEDNDGKIQHLKKWIHIMPEELSVISNIIPETRKRGIFKSTVYTAKINMSGFFKPQLDNYEQESEVLYNEAILSLGITDNRGIKGKINFSVNKTPLQIEPGLICQDLMKNGINAKLNQIDTINNKKIGYDLNFSISGTTSLQFLPVGKQTTTDITSTWNDPKFSGSFLPITRTINDKGFSAHYEITNLNRTFPQQWTGSKYNIFNSSFGVDLYVPNNHYQKSLRSAKYGILFIILTTLIFLFIELYKKKQIHYLQYLLVSLALVLFFSILTALSEHIGFNWAYIVASVAIITLITSYSKLLLNDKQVVYWIGGLITSLYTFLFVLLQLNDYAFLAGNIGLFIILAIIMKVSSKIKLK
ncbi:cell envelope integrity protein CreD [Plebeiibacterium sediminum]|uniref:Cell envelope integrity protein CreD n=1 Tax=Plebeiibacterium sediminum TaxID=2992112 RepID=A0AAE3M1E8_9BACT|nr:cell envelope integrity protein CreD [Plebeiobacterium sediminum]MCW3785452.1 cell envelope integrity protein CreD [Plebeiobacterium sediminum]